MSTTATKGRSNAPKTTGTTTPNRRKSGGDRHFPATRSRVGRHRVLVAAVVIGLTLWLGTWVVAAATVVYGAHLRSTGWTWARVAMHLVGAATAISLVVFVATSFGPGPGLLAGVVAILIWQWDRKRPMVVTVTATNAAAAVDLETQLDAAFAEGFNRGQRELRTVRRSMERFVPAFDPNDPDSF